MNTHELAWAAGFFDGEGTIGSDRGSRSLNLAVGQVNREPLERFQEAVGGLGKIYFEKRSRRNPTWQDFYHFRVGRWADVQAIIAMLWKYLSEPKRAQAEREIRDFHSKPRKIIQPALGRDGFSTRCGKGHVRTPENTMVKPNGTRVCRVCANARMKAKWRDDPEWRERRLAYDRERQKGRLDKHRVYNARYRAKKRAEREQLKAEGKWVDGRSREARAAKRAAS